MGRVEFNDGAVRGDSPGASLFRLECRHLGHDARHAKHLRRCLQNFDQPLCRTLSSGGIQNVLLKCGVWVQRAAEGSAADSVTTDKTEQRHIVINVDMLAEAGSNGFQHDAFGQGYLKGWGHPVETKILFCWRARRHQ
ncbi:hypothetical protein D9M72_492240 [compost metagenome]